MLKQLCIRALARKYPTDWENNLKECDPLQQGTFVSHSQKQKAKSYKKDMQSSDATYPKALALLSLDISQALRTGDKQDLIDSLTQLNKLTLSWISKL
jgi:hypothetical protein